MTILRKPLSLISLFLFLALVYFMLGILRTKDSYHYMYKQPLLTEYPPVSISTKQKIHNIFKNVQSYIDLKMRGNAVKHYMTDEIRFRNIDAIKNITQSELNELRSLGLELDKPKDVQDHLSGEKNQAVENNKPISKLIENNKKESEKTSGNVIGITSTVVTHSTGDTVNIVSMDRKYRQRKIVSKLSEEHRALELVTDPLPASAECSGKAFLIVLIVSSPENYERRQSIRNSWAYAYPNDYKLLKDPKNIGETIPVKNMFKAVFVIGRAKDEGIRNKILEETGLSKDIILGDFLEDYTNLTMKTRLALKWSYYECNTLYTLKTDDDVFVNPVMLVEWLKIQQRKNFYTGWCNFHSPVVRAKNSKWYVSPEDYSGSTYPGYCLGGGYLMSNDVVGKVMDMSYGRKLFPMEDLYVGLMINDMREVVIQDEKKHFDLVYSGRSSDCELNDLFLAHRVLGKGLVTHIERARKALASCPQ